MDMSLAIGLALLASAGLVPVAGQWRRKVRARRSRDGGGDMAGAGWGDRDADGGGEGGGDGGGD